ncbi:hypothetical protein YB2330_004622 [Saitoella coloradoensis]
METIKQLKETATRAYEETVAKMSSVEISEKSGNADFVEEREGWHGYIEWEDYPEKKKLAAAILAKFNFTPIPEFQLKPLPETNPILIGHRWKEYYQVLGPTMANWPEESWEIVKKEKGEKIIHVLDFPYNGEPPADELMKGKITDNKYHFVRNHGNIPVIDPEKWSVDIGGMVNEPKRLTLHDLKTKFPIVEMTVTLQCSGTRRIEQIHEYPGEGDELINAPWAEGAIGTAKYKGVSLKKVLKYCGGLKDGAQHLEFIGADTYFKKGQVYNYAVSVPWRKVKSNEVLLVWEMNGEPLPLIHGAPVRAVVTGYIGARSCKFLYKINALAYSSMGPVQRQEYLNYNHQVGKHNVKFSNGFSIQDMPVSSAMMFPKEKQVVIHDGKIECQGWAYSGGGRWVERVEVSPDGGHTWFPAAVQDMTTKHYHAWRLWKLEVPTYAEGWIELCVRCWDNANNTEPTFVRSAWNWDLHVTSSSHRVKIYSVNRTYPETAERLRMLKEHGEEFEPITKPVSFAVETPEEYEKNVKEIGDREPID